MRNISNNYSVLGVDTVQLAPGEKWRFRQEAASASFGFFGLGGYTTMLEGAVVGRTFSGEGQWCLNNAELGWSNDAIGHSEMLLEASDNGAYWVCLSRNATGDREITHVQLDGEATIPAGWGFVVARGEAQFEDKIATQLAYVRPREADMLVTGTGDLLLVR